MSGNIIGQAKEYACKQFYDGIAGARSSPGNGAPAPAEASLRPNICHRRQSADYSWAGERGATTERLGGIR